MAMLTAHNLADEDPVLLESLENHFQNNGLARLKLLPEIPEGEGTPSEDGGLRSRSSFRVTKFHTSFCL